MLKLERKLEPDMEFAEASSINSGFAISRFVASTMAAISLIALTGCVVPWPHTSLRSDEISGRVIDAKTGLPLEGAIVSPVSTRGTNADVASTPTATSDSTGHFKLPSSHNMHWTTVVLAPCYGSIHEGGAYYSQYLVSKAGYVPVSFCAYEVPTDKGHNRDRISLAEEIPLSLGQSKIPEVWPPPPDLQFLDHDRTYFVEFARACDSLMQQHPLGTNAFIQIPGTVSSLPPIIRNVRYGINDVYVLTNRVSVYVAAPRLGYSITWKPQKESGTNLWVLATFWRDTEKVAYTEHK